MPLERETQAAEGAAGLYRKDLAHTPGEAIIRYKGGVLAIKAIQVVKNMDAKTGRAFLGEQGYKP